MSNHVSIKQPLRRVTRRVHELLPEPTPTQWVLLQESLVLVRKFLQDSQRLPVRAWKTWLWIMGGGWLATLLFLLLLIWGMRTLDAMGILAQEQDWLRWIVQKAPFDFSKAVWLSSPGDIISIIMILLLASIMALRTGHPLRGLTIFLSYFMVSVVVLIGWKVWSRPRPELILDGVAAPDFHSFPSGHMAQSTAFYGLICYLWVRRSRQKSEQIVAILLLIVLLVLIALSRLVLGTHWVTDLVASLLVGGVWLTAMIIALRKAEAAADGVPV